MAQKEPRDAEPDSASERPDPAAAQREQFANWLQAVQHKARVARSLNPMTPLAAPHVTAAPLPVAVSSPMAAPDPFASLREELPADELTAVFAPSPELLARSGAPPPAGSAWEEPTQVVHIEDVRAAFSSARSSAPPSDGAPRSARPTLEQLDFERKLVALATPVPATPRRTHWFWWAVAAMLGGAVSAAIAEYSLHPTPARGPAHAGAGVNSR